ncbi:MAG: hypothetical protein GOMPHAMPRED_003843 [Gomphillus americanus]|uniref:Uncharacterized protein n=1 Tax=Gomphillus americanus TaxID=1940652 RepID=A0A8H3FLY8_9LECA|nr:MAG: hypothetical protein GOMPHAMPRED_003843 [Gomphillus americanus]
MRAVRLGLKLGCKTHRARCYVIAKPRSILTQYKDVTARHEWSLVFARCSSLASTQNSNGYSSQSPTIYALSTASGRAAIAIVRCSGNLCLEIYQALCPGAPPLKPRRAALRTLLDPTCGGGKDTEVIDSQALLLYFPSPNTTTGEDVLEIHIHGGPAIIKALLRAIPKCVPLSQSHIRYAEPGEFTRRAFYNNRLDLTQVEALGDILSAETEQHRRLAVSGMSNTLNQRYRKWRTQLLCARGELEALIDFAEDQHFDESAEDFVRSISKQIRTLVSQINKTTANAAKGELLRHGIKIALLGAPNAGKSSLLNRIVGREAAIVSSEAGTTRDVIEVNVDIGGFFCKFKDLAGIRSSATDNSTIGEIEQEGINRAKAHAREADIVIALIPFGQDQKSDDNTGLAFDLEILDFVKQELQEQKRVVFAMSKSDLANQSAGELVEPAKLYLQNTLGVAVNMIPISCLGDGDDTAQSEIDSRGIQGLLDHLTREISELTAAEQIEETSSANQSIDASLGTTQRQQELLKQCAAALQEFLQIIHPNELAGTTDTDEIDVVLAAEKLRVAADCLAKITGQGESGDVEEVLGVVFEKFCVGK